MHVPAVLIFSLLSALSSASPVVNAVEERTPTCSYVPRLQYPKKLHCEQFGTLKTPDPFDSFSTTSFIVCRNTCIQNRQCISFGLDSTSSTCTLYSASLDDQGFKQSATNVQYANHHCYKRVCTHATTTTTSTSTTSSVSVCTPTPTQCGLSGVQWAYLETSNGNNNDNPEAGVNFAVDDFINYTPYYAGVTETIGNIEVRSHVRTYNFYGQYQTSGASAFLNHQGYFYVPADGVYAFYFSDIDNVAYLWTGPIAYSGYNSSNVLMSASYTPNPYNSATLTLTCGTYLPIRVQWANGGKPGSFYFDIVGPDGTSYNPVSGPTNIVQYSCDGTTAPPFPAYGSTQDPNGVIGSSCDNSGYSYVASGPDISCYNF